MLKIEVDGKLIEMPHGSTVMDATNKLGVYVPHFCYHKKLSIAANCRMCLVEVEKAPQAPAGLCHAGDDGMKVWTHSKNREERAERQGLGRLLDLDQAHAAVGRDRQLLVIAEVRHVDAELVGGVHHGGPVGHLDQLAVDFDLEHLGGFFEMEAAAPSAARPHRAGSACARCDARIRRGSA